MKYNWQQHDWPQFSYNLRDFGGLLEQLNILPYHLAGILRALPENVATETTVDFLVSEAIKTSEIEGEYLSREDVRSSICANLGIFNDSHVGGDPRAKGIADLMTAVRTTFAHPLSEQMLFDWHTLLMLGVSHIDKGKWRSNPEPMRVISGPMGRWKIHFEAPPSIRVPDEMQSFIDWFNQTAPGGSREIKSAAVRAAIAHLYFESIHPFEDGNGRIGRALAEKVLFQGFGAPILVSLSQTIEAGRKDYYSSLKNAQTTNEITSWIGYFLETVFKAHQQAEQRIDFVIRKTHYLDKYRDSLSERQSKVILRIMQEGPEGFTGGMTAKKYCSLTSVSKATATRDLQQLESIGALKKLGQGRTTSYVLPWL